MSDWDDFMFWENERMANGGDPLPDDPFYNPCHNFNSCQNDNYDSGFWDGLGMMFLFHLFSRRH